MRRTNTLKRALTWILTLTMVVMLLPTFTSFANVAVTERLDFVADSTARSGPGWTWDGNKQLTLTDLNLTVSGTSLVIGMDLPNDTKIVLYGNNTIICTSNSDAYGIRANGALTIEGSGTLKIEATGTSSSANGIRMIGGSTLTIKDSTTVDVTATSNWACYGIRNGTIKIEDTATFIVKSSSNSNALSNNTGLFYPSGHVAVKADGSPLDTPHKSGSAFPSSEATVKIYIPKAEVKDQLTTPLDFVNVITASQNKLNDEGWAWDAVSKTLTLDGLNLQVTDSKFGIDLPADSIILLNGDNTVNSIADGGSGIQYKAGTLTIQGDGSLYTKGNSTGGSAYGINGNYAISIKENAKVKAEGIGTLGNGFGIHIQTNDPDENKININDAAELIVIGDGGGITGIQNVTIEYSTGYSIKSYRDGDYIVDVTHTSGQPFSMNYINIKIAKFPATSAEVKSVSVTPKSAKALIAGTRQFSAAVAAVGGVDDTVEWIVTGGNGGSTIDANGLLSVSTSETIGATLTVTATSTADSTKSDSATVTVVNNISIPNCDNIYVDYTFKNAFTGASPLEFVYDTDGISDIVIRKESNGKKYISLTAPGTAAKRLFDAKNRISKGAVEITASVKGTGTATIEIYDANGTTILEAGSLRSTMAYQDLTVMYELGAGEQFGGFSIATTDGTLDVDRVTIKTSEKAPALNNTGKLTARGVPAEYWITLPKGYDPDRAEPYPVMIQNPRPGDLSSDSECEILQYNATMYNGGNHPFIVVTVRMMWEVGTAMSLYGGKFWDYASASFTYSETNTDPTLNEILVLDLFEQIKRDYNAADKFYFGGNHSAAGNGAWETIVYQTEHLAAASMGDPSGAWDIFNKKFSLMNRPVDVSNPYNVEVPIRMFSNEDGNPDGLPWGINFAYHFNSLGFRNFEVVPIGGHWYMMSEQMDFFLAHYKQENPGMWLPPVNMGIYPPLNTDFRDICMETLVKPVVDPVTFKITNLDVYDTAKYGSLEYQISNAAETGWDKWMDYVDGIDVTGKVNQISIHVRYKGTTTGGSGIGAPGYKPSITSAITKIEIDKTAPVISITGVEDNGLYNKPVTPTVCATDVNLDSTNITLNGQPYTGNAIDIDGSYTLKVTAIDKAGNKSESSIGFTVDQTPPEITVNGVKDGDVVKLNQDVAVTWSCSDKTSGIDTSIGDLPSDAKLDTSKVGPHTLTFTATDKAGNKKVISITYYVHYDYSGVLNPINNDGSDIFNLGSTIPVKFQLKDAKGTFITDAVAKLYIAEITGDKAEMEFDAVSTSSASNDNSARYDSAENQYIFNLNTKDLKAGVYQIRIELGDGTTNTVKINLK